MKQAAVKVRRVVLGTPELAEMVLSEDVVIVNSENEYLIKGGDDPAITLQLLTQDQRHPGRTFPGIELRLTGPGGVIMQADSVRAHLLAKFKEHDADGWTDVIGGDGEYAYRLVGDQSFQLQFRAVELSVPADWDEEDDDGDQESLAFDLTFDPAQMCAACVSALNPPNASWQVRGIDPQGRYLDMHNVATTVKWARELLAAGGRIETPDRHILPMYAAAVFRGTPLCEYDLTPALRGNSGFKF